MLVKCQLWCLFPLYDKLIVLGHKQYSKNVCRQKRKENYSQNVYVETLDTIVGMQMTHGILSKIKTLLKPLIQ